MSERELLCRLMKHVDSLSVGKGDYRSLIVAHAPPQLRSFGVSDAVQLAVKRGYLDRLDVNNSDLEMVIITAEGRLFLAQC